MCQDNGLVILQFAPNTWPFSESTRVAQPELKGEPHRR